jgi:hypothetical protein
MLTYKYQIRYIMVVRYIRICFCFFQIAVMLETKRIILKAKLKLKSGKF